MIISIAEARQLMGKASKKYSDVQVEEVLNIFEFMADIAIDCYVLRRKKLKEIQKRKENENEKTIK